MLSHQAVIETLSVGATMLLPPLRERMELLHSLLPQGPDRWESLSKGQVVQNAQRCTMCSILFSLFGQLLFESKQWISFSVC